MLTCEGNAYKIITDATTKYKNHFGNEFPVDLYLDVTYSNGYSYSMAGAKRLESMIQRKIDNNDTRIRTAPKNKIINY